MVVDAGPGPFGNSVDVLVDGTSALAEMEAAIRGAQRSVHIAGWHASPEFELTRGPGALPLRDLLAEVAARLPVRLLLWAGPPLPLFQPTRAVVKKARDEFVRDSQVRCALDKRERTMHCHHEKIIVVDDTLAFVGGMDLTALQEIGTTTRRTLPAPDWAGTTRRCACADPPSPMSPPTSPSGGARSRGSG